MKTVNAKGVAVGDVVVVDGRERKVVDVQKASKGPKYHITFQWSNTNKVTRTYHVNSKFWVFKEAS